MTSFRADEVGVGGVGFLQEGYFEVERYVSEVMDTTHGAYDIEGVHLGMSKTEVESVAGPPANVSASGNRWNYESSDDYPNAKLKLGFVVFTKLGRVYGVGGWRLWRRKQMVVGPTFEREDVHSALGSPTSDDEWVYDLEDGSQLEVTQPKSYTFVHFLLRYPNW